MSQIEQDFRQLLHAKPEIEKCYAEGLVNRRALARYLIQKGLAQKNQIDAVIAMLRRYPFDVNQKEAKDCRDLMKQTRITIKDKVAILDFKKEKTLLQKLQKIITHTDYDKGDTLKIIMGSSSVKVCVDQKKTETLKEELEDYTLNNTQKNISEISILFPEPAIKTKGILAMICAELATHNIIITEFLTASPELLIYVKEEYVVTAYEVIKQLQK